MALFTSRNLLRARSFLDRGTQGVAKGGLLMRKAGTQAERAAKNVAPFIPSEKTAKNILELAKTVRKVAM